MDESTSAVHEKKTISFLDGPMLENLGDLEGLGHLDLIFTRVGRTPHTHVKGDLQKQARLVRIFLPARDLGTGGSGGTVEAH